MIVQTKIAALNFFRQITKISFRFFSFNEKNGGFVKESKETETASEI
jgi:hypothetical protein